VTAGLGGRKALVTGAGGFIGAHLCSALVGGEADVRALVRYNSRDDHGALDWLEPDVAEEIEAVSGDLRDPESVVAAVQGAEVVFHLAAQIAIPYSYVNPRDFFETNVIGSLNVAQASLSHGVERLVHTSTSEVYGSAQTVPISEEHPLQAQSPYAASKVGADKLMDSFHRSFGLRAVVLRPFNTFGPFQSARAVIPTIVSQALAGGPVRLGSLHPRRDLTFVTDTAAGFMAVTANESTIGRTIQLGTGVDVSIGELVQAVGEILGRELEVEVEEERIRPEDSEVERLLSSPRLAEELTGWRPTVSLREGLERTIPWIQANLDRYRADQYVR
jgi:NAD dependent epimerase/dehydratase